MTVTAQMVGAGPGSQGPLAGALGLDGVLGGLWM